MLICEIAVLFNVFRTTLLFLFLLDVPFCPREQNFEDMVCHYISITSCSQIVCYNCSILTTASF